MFRRAVAFVFICLAIWGGVVVGRVLLGSDRSDPTEVAGAHRPTPEADTDPPAIEVTSRMEGLDPFKPVSVKGEVDEDAVISLGGRKQEVPAGRFSMRLPRAPRVPIQLWAREAAGNVAERTLEFSLAWPPMRAVHVSGYAWASPSYRKVLMKMVDDRLINTIQLDLKDESGVISYRSEVPLAQKIEASTHIYNLVDALRVLHKRGIRVVGRIVCFRDPVLAEASWPQHKERVIQTADGAPYADYGGFTNFANEVVRDYNIDIAEEAARAGIDDILYDYVRRPEGDLATMQFPGLLGPAEVSVARFVADSKAVLGETMLGISVFGISASRPEPTAQDMGLLAPNVDYVAPMVYPSLWGSGEYNVADPENQPGEIVGASLADFQRVMAGSGAAIVPWLQDFNGYGPPQIQAQIEAATGAGSLGFIMWNPNSTYVTEGLLPLP